jgi:hypothetical protein
MNICSNTSDAPSKPTSSGILAANKTVEIEGILLSLADIQMLLALELSSQSQLPRDSRQ